MLFLSYSVLHTLTCSILSWVLFRIFFYFSIFSLLTRASGSTWPFPVTSVRWLEKTSHNLRIRRTFIFFFYTHLFFGEILVHSAGVEVSLFGNKGSATLALLTFLARWFLVVTDCLLYAVEYLIAFYLTIALPFSGVKSKNISRHCEVFLVEGGNSLGREPLL